VVGQFDLQAPHEGGLDHPRDETAVAGQLDLAGVNLREQPVQCPTRGELGCGLRPGQIEQRCWFHYADLRIMPMWSWFPLQDGVSVLARSA
jgi:hypothetical protein